MEVEPKNQIEAANQAAQALREATDNLNKAITRAEELKITDILSGRAEAGIVPAEPKVETPQEYAKRILANKP